MDKLKVDDFMETAPGRALALWESSLFDRLVINQFGFGAMQVGLPMLPALRENRMQMRFQIVNADPESLTCPTPAGVRPVAAEPEALPFPEESMGLVVLPHTLDFAESPQHALREAVRILEPEGRLVLSAFNPTSPWWARQRLVHFGARPYLPTKTLPIGLSRLRDWLTLLGLEIDQGHFGVYAPPLKHFGRLERWRWLDKAGDRWFPQGANLIVLSAVKRLPGARLIGKVRFSLGDALMPGAPAVGMPRRNNGASKQQKEEHD